MSRYKMSVEFLIGRVEDIIETLENDGLEKEYEKEIKELKKRIEVVKRYEVD